MWYASSNRDETRYEDPDRFDVHRNPEHQAFGAGGRHFCLGTALARLELKILFEETLARYPEMELAGEPTLRRVAVPQPAEDAAGAARPVADPHTRGPTSGIVRATPRRITGENGVHSIRGEYMSASRSMRRLRGLFGAARGARRRTFGRPGGDSDDPDAERRRRHHVHRPDRRQRRPALVLGHLHDASTAPRSTSTSASRRRPRAGPTATSRSSASSTAGAARSWPTTSGRLGQRRLRVLLA